MKTKVDYILSGILLSIIFIFFYKTHANIFSYNLDIAGHEQFLVNYIQILYNTGELYFNSYIFPYCQNLYTPIYFLMNDAVLQLKNTSNELDIRSIYIVGRYISWIACIVNVFVIYFIARQLKVSTTISLIACVFYLFNISNHSFAARPDSIKDLLFSINVLFLILYVNRHQIIYLASSILFSVASIYTKQDSLIYIYGFSIFLLLIRDFKTFILYNFLVTTFTLLIFFVINYYTNGKFLDNLFNTNIEFSWVFWDRWVQQILLFIRVTWPSWLIIILAFTYRNNIYKISALISLAFLIIVLLVTIKFGAANNYYTQLYFVFFITSAYSLHLILKKSEFKTIKLISISLVLLSLYNLKFPAAKDLKTEKIFKKEYLEIKEVSYHLKSNYNGYTFLILDQSFVPFMPHNMMFINFSLVYFDFLYSKYGFETEQKLIISKSYDNEYIRNHIQNIDYLMLKDNERNSILFNKKYKKNYQAVENYKGYNIYINKLLVQ